MVTRQRTSSSTRGRGGGQRTGSIGTSYKASGCPMGRQRAGMNAPRRAWLGGMVAPEELWNLFHTLSGDLASAPNRSSSLSNKLLMQLLLPMLLPDGEAWPTPPSFRGWRGKPVLLLLGPGRLSPVSIWWQRLAGSRRRAKRLRREYGHASPPGGGASLLRAGEATARVCVGCHSRPSSDPVVDLRGRNLTIEMAIGAMDTSQIGRCCA